jgi:tetratricopeptide (TPR) repeat protein
MRGFAAAVMLVFAFVAAADDLARAEQLAYAKQFAEAEALYRRIVEREPTPAARLGLARVVMWQGRYAEAIALFARLDGVEAQEGRATAEYWSGDYRAAAKRFRRVLELDPKRDFARTSLAEIESTMVPAQRLVVDGFDDDQPYDGIRTSVEATFFSDPLTRWTAEVGRYSLAGRSGELASIGNETKVKRLTISGTLGIFTWPDGVRRPVGAAALRWRKWSLGVDRHPELATATSLDDHVASTTTYLRWNHDRNWLAAVELSHRSYSDDNEGRGFSAYAVAPLRRGGWTLWSGASVSARDTDQTRFTFPGRYDPYWTPEELIEARVVGAVEGKLARASVKLHADAGRARDRGRMYTPWRAGLSAGFAWTADLRLEASFERSSTVDYRVNSFHAALVRRR